MANFVITYTASNLLGLSGYKVMYRVTGTSLWTSLQTSGTTASFQGTDNFIYDIQVQELSTPLNNPVSTIGQDIYFTDPGPVITPTNTTVGFYFGNLSSFIDSYITTVSLFSDPGTIIGTHTLSPADTVTDSFPGLTALTQYYLTITPTANQFSKTFTYTFTTESKANCPAPQNVIATLN